jgi:hypothetical protein
MRILLVASSLLLAALACAPGAALAQGSEQTAVAQACASMGIDPAVSTYGACERSLAKSMQSMTAARRLAREQAACRGQGYHWGTRAFALCVLDREAAAQPSQTEVLGAPKMIAASSADLADHYQRGDQATSVRRACAMIGAAPGTQDFQTCTGNLNMTINDEDLDANGY